MWWCRDVRSARLDCEALGMREVLVAHEQWPSISTPMLAKLLPKRFFSSGPAAAQDEDDDVDAKIDDDGANETETDDVVAAMAREWLSRAPPSDSGGSAAAVACAASSSTASAICAPTVADDSGHLVYKSTLCAQLSQAAKATLRSSNDRLKRVKLSGGAVSLLASSVKGGNDAEGSRLVAGDWVACLFSPGGGKRFWSLGELVAIRRTDGKKDTVRSVEWSPAVTDVSTMGSGASGKAEAKDSNTDDMDARFPFSVLCLWLKASSTTNEGGESKNTELRHLLERDDEVTDHVDYPLSSVLLRLDATDVQYHRGESGLDEKFSISSDTHAAITTAFKDRCRALAQGSSAQKGKADKTAQAASRIAAQTYGMVSSAAPVVTRKGRQSKPKLQMQLNT